MVSFDQASQRYTVGLLNGGKKDVGEEKIRPMPRLPPVQEGSVTAQRMQVSEGPQSEQNHEHGRVRTEDEAPRSLEEQAAATVQVI